MPTCLASAEECTAARLLPSQGSQRLPPRAPVIGHTNPSATLPPSDPFASASLIGPTLLPGISPRGWGGFHQFRSQPCNRAGPTTPLEPRSLYRCCLGHPVCRDVRFGGAVFASHQKARPPVLISCRGPNVPARLLARPPYEDFRRGAPRVQFPSAWPSKLPGLVRLPGWDFHPQAATSFAGRAGVQKVRTPYFPGSQPQARTTSISRPEARLPSRPCHPHYRFLIILGWSA